MYLQYGFNVSWTDLCMYPGLLGIIVECSPLKNISCLLLYMTLKFCIVDIFCNALRDHCYLIRLMNALYQLWNELPDDWFRVFKFPPCCYLIFDQLPVHIFRDPITHGIYVIIINGTSGIAVTRLLGVQFVFFGAAQYFCTYLAWNFSLQNHCYPVADYSIHHQDEIMISYYLMCNKFSLKLKYMSVNIQSIIS